MGTASYAAPVVGAPVVSAVATRYSFSAMDRIATGESLSSLRKRLAHKHELTEERPRASCCAGRTRSARRRLLVGDSPRREQGQGPD